MATYKCKNFGSCSRADSGDDFSLAAGVDDKCSECGSTLVRTGEGGTDESAPSGKTKHKTLMIVAAAAALMLVLVGTGYMKWGDNRVVELKAESLSPPLPATAPLAPSAPLIAASESTAVGKPTAMVANEVAARKTCDEATKTGQPDANKVCRRATAVTLMNSGVLSAIAGKLDEADKDYSAAKDKDPDFPELYFNLAVLKARQGKGSETIDNLTLAVSKGFTQYSAIKAEPALQKLKSDPLLKAKIEAFEIK